MRVAVTGAAGFVGSNFVRMLLEDHPEVSVLALYSGSDQLPESPSSTSRLRVVAGELGDPETADALAANSEVIVHFADPSAGGGEGDVDGLRRNLLGTLSVLEAASRQRTHLHHVSTDKVLGELSAAADTRFTASSPLCPSSVTAAGQAAADLLVQAWIQERRVFATVSLSPNDYGPYQPVDKFIPRTITNRMLGIRPRIYGDGRNVRDWIHVRDHAEAIWEIVEKGQTGETYLIGADGEMANRDVARLINELMGYPRDDLEYVPEKKSARDERRALDPSRMNEELGWYPTYTSMREGLEETIAWYASNSDWWEPTKASMEAQFTQSHR